MSGDAARIPEHSVRVSDRARRPRLTVTPEDGLVVVLPRGYPASAVPDILRRHAAWIARTLERTAERREHVAAAARAEVPDCLDLPGIGLRLRVERCPGSGAKVRARLESDAVVLSGAVEDREACLQALRALVRRVARERLPLMFGGIEAETGWHATRVTVRRQKTRWGSCNSKSAISLNESLAFLPPHLVRHVFIHELAHTRKLDHSPQFWALVARFDAEWRMTRRELKDAWRFVPPWAGRD